jgi:hypothetical protein
MGRSFGPELLNFKYTNKLSYRFWTKSPVNKIGETFAGKRNMRRYLDTLFIMSEFLKRQPSQLYRGCKTRGGRAFIPCFTNMLSNSFTITTSIRSENENENESRTKK